MPSPPNVIIYTRPFCGFCSRAISLLRQKGVDFTEIEAGFDPAKRKEMVQRSGRTTFPQIFVGDTHIGGCDELLALDGAGKFDPMLQA
jgi:glutaredoxin 3